MPDNMLSLISTESYKENILGQVESWYFLLAHLCYKNKYFEIILLLTTEHQLLWTKETVRDPSLIDKAIICLK